jgi:hypothetical protein
MKQTLLWVLAFGLILCGCGQKESAESKPAKAGESPLNAPADYLGAVVKAKKAAEKTVGGASVDQAIKTFFTQENRYPKDLDELVSSGVIPKLPVLPDGMKFDYNPTNGTVKVVSQK